MTAVSLIRRSPVDQSSTISDKQLVLPSVQAVSTMFGDGRWDLSAADHHDGRSTNSTIIDWTEVDQNHPGWACTLRELCFHRLNTRLPDRQTVSVYVAAREQLRLRRFLRWLKQRTNVTGPAELTQSHVHQYRLHLARHAPEDAIPASGANRREGQSAAPWTVWTYLSPLVHLDAYGEHLTEGLSFNPYGGQLTATFLGHDDDREDNETPPLPDAVLRPLVSGALRYLDHYAPQIVALRNERMTDWASRAYGTHSKGWKTVFQPCPETGSAWGPDLQQTSKAQHHLFRQELACLIGACLVIILYLSGMRPGELCNLRQGCRKSVIDPDTGLRERWRLVGKPLKKKRGQHADDAEWVVPDLVQRAVEVLIDLLAPFREMHGSDLLALNQNALRTAQRRSPTEGPKGQSEKRRGKDGYPLSTSALNDMINLFYARVREQDPSAPDYSVMPSQFRRTLARHIAREPGGIIAGKLQYHHVSTAVFEGYAGSYDDTFALDVEDERIMAGIDILEELRTDVRTGWQAGATATTVLEAWEHAREPLILEGVVDTSASSSVLSANVRQIAASVHVGALTYCIFDPVRARCLTPDEKALNKSTPNINACSPDACANASIRSCHIPQWTALLSEVDALAANARSGPQRTALKEASKRYASVIEKAST